ncbi:MAG TPA: helicase C-terminal domain-containing protein [Longimicrobiales bacterium]|nr:helicase C-terminal domain-containing protein [Longimicrobiales bacterium]
MARTLYLTPQATEQIRGEIARARGNEVCFLAYVGEDGDVYDPRPVARGHKAAVVAAVREAEAGMLVLHNHPSGTLEPSDPDLEIAAALHEQGIGLAITDNQGRELYVVVEPATPREYVPLDEAAIDAALGPEGPVSRLHPGYEDRPQQRELARAVAQGYNEGGVAIAEAGTGTGKSIAYLLPAVRWAAQNRERTVVSTNTINLQEQLVGKDLPFLRRALGEPFRFALVKGRRNYVSIRRAQLALQTAGMLFDDGQRAELETLARWLKTTREGSLQDLPFTPSPEVWDEVASESDVCLRAKCPHFEQCFYQRARRDASTADILVVNHHLLFSDLAVRRTQNNYTAPAVLPHYKRVILDEAHNIEDAATSHLGATVSRRGVLRLLARLDRRGRGVLSAVEERLRVGKDDLLQQDALRMVDSELRPAVDRAREETAGLFERLEALTAASEDGVVRLADADGVRLPELVALDTAVENATLALDAVCRGIIRLGERILLDARWAESLEEQLLELQGSASRVQAAADSLRLALGPGEEGLPMVRWVERRGGGPMKEANVTVRAAPVDLSAALRDALFERVETAVLTSATLATRDGFGFLRSRIGLAGGAIKLREAVYPSPFAYEEQTLLAIPTDLPSPAGESLAYDRATADVAFDVADACDGGVFVLFTSYRALRNVAAELRRRRADGRWPLFVQGEVPRARLVEGFTQSGRGILLGVASFWEGVDVPGDPLRGLVLTRLPFKVPGEPLTAARIEAVERDGGNAFYDYQLPHAALRLKQGFGRLIRSRRDRGAVVLLDRRVVEKGYGRYFLESLPPAPVVRGPWRELIARLEAFYR